MTERKNKNFASTAASALRKLTVTGAVIVGLGELGDDLKKDVNYLKVFACGATAALLWKGKNDKGKEAPNYIHLWDALGKVVNEEKPVDKYPDIKMEVINSMKKQNG